MLLSLTSQRSRFHSGERYVPVWVVFGPVRYRLGSGLAEFERAEHKTNSDYG